MLRADRLGRRVDGRWIWRRLDLRVAPGERVALVGPSGSGKSLLLRTLAGLDPADEGSVTFRGRTLEAWTPPRYRAMVTYLPQGTELGEGTVESNLRVPFGFRVHADESFDRARAVGILEALDRSEAFLDKPSEELSGGEEQIAALTRVLLLAPRVLLLDEPAASMDGQLARAAEALVESWRSQDDERAVVWTSHQADRVERVADRTVILDGEAA